MLAVIEGALAAWASAKDRPRTARALAAAAAAAVIATGLTLHFASGC